MHAVLVHNHKTEEKGMRGRRMRGEEGERGGGEVREREEGRKRRKGKGMRREGGERKDMFKESSHES